MSTKDNIEIRKVVMTNPAINPQMREYFALLETRLRANNIWATTTTTSSTTTSTTSTTSSTSSTTTTTSTTSSTTTTTTA